MKRLALLLLIVFLALGCKKEAQVIGAPDLFTASAQNIVSIDEVTNPNPRIQTAFISANKNGYTYITEMGNKKQIRFSVSGKWRAASRGAAGPLLDYTSLKGYSKVIRNGLPLMCLIVKFTTTEHNGQVRNEYRIYEFSSMALTVTCHTNKLKISAQAYDLDGPVGYTDNTDYPRKKMTFAWLP